MKDPKFKTVQFLQWSPSQYFRMLLFVPEFHNYTVLNWRTSA